MDIQTYIHTHTNKYTDTKNTNCNTFTSPMKVTLIKYTKHKSNHQSNTKLMNFT